MFSNLVITTRACLGFEEGESGDANKLTKPEKLSPGRRKTSKEVKGFALPTITDHRIPSLAPSTMYVCSVSTD
jgi:hypothetical protein